MSGSEGIVHGIAELPAELEKLAEYIADRGIVSVRTINFHFGKPNNYSEKQIGYMLLRLLDWDLIDLNNDQVIWSEL